MNEIIKHMISDDTNDKNNNEEFNKYTHYFRKCLNYLLEHPTIVLLSTFFLGSLVRNDDLDPTAMAEQAS